MMHPLHFNYQVSFLMFSPKEACRHMWYYLSKFRKYSLWPADLYSSPVPVCHNGDTWLKSVWTVMLPQFQLWNHCLLFPYLPTTLIPVFVPSQSGIPVSNPATCSLVHSVPEVFMPVAEVLMVATRLHGKGGGFGNRTGTDFKGRVWGAGNCYTEIEGVRQPMYIYILNNPIFKHQHFCTPAKERNSIGTSVLLST